MIFRHATLAVAAGAVLAATGTAQTPAPAPTPICAPSSFAVPIPIPDAPPAVTVPFMRYAVSFARPYEMSFAPTVIHLQHNLSTDVGRAGREYVVPTITGRTTLDFHMGRGLGTAVGVDAASNALFAGAPADREQVVRVEAVAPAPPQQVVVRAEFVLVPLGFYDDAGLAAWPTCAALSARERKLLAAAIRHAPGREVLAAPTLVCTDNQQASFKSGGPTDGLEWHATPRLTPDGKVLLRQAVRLTDADGATRNTASVETTETIPVGGTLVVRGLRKKTAAGESADLLAVVTVTAVVPEPK